MTWNLSSPVAGFRELHDNILYEMYVTKAIKNAVFVRHAMGAIVLCPKPNKQWLMNHISDLMTVRRSNTQILIIITG